MDVTDRKSRATAFVVLESSFYDLIWHQDSLSSILKVTQSEPQKELGKRSWKGLSHNIWLQRESIMQAPGKGAEREPKEEDISNANQLWNNLLMCAQLFQFLQVESSFSQWLPLSGSFWPSFLCLWKQEIKKQDIVLGETTSTCCYLAVVVYKKCPYLHSLSLWNGIMHWNIYNSDKNTS